MSKRLRFFAIVAGLGYVGGVILCITLDLVMPRLVEMVPYIVTVGDVRAIISGFTGAILTLISVTVGFRMNECLDKVTAKGFWVRVIELMFCILGFKEKENNKTE